MNLARKTFVADNFLLDTKIAERLYFECAANLPIIDYHNHLPPMEVAQNKKFENMTQIWLDGDHYKWRAMRTFGINESYITGNKSDKEKFLKWAETTPYTIRSPLYHWTHMELKRPFGINSLLNPTTAENIYQETSEKLQTEEYAVQSILSAMNVEVICTTDDPVDNLEHHRNLAHQNTAFTMLPAWRPDKAMAVEKIETFLAYKDKLALAANMDVHDLDSYLQALQNRHDHFHTHGCRLSDHGLNHIVCVSFTATEVHEIFMQLLNGKKLDQGQIDKIQSFFLIEFARMDHAKGWVQQYHLGALRNNNGRKLMELGPNTGFDSIGDFPQAQQLSRFLDILNDTDQLAKTILYNLNPADNEIIAAMTGNFNDGTVKGKMQYGSGWWFLDQLDGMERQLNVLSNLGLLSCFIGMLTDSRSFLSFPRHEYFRRLLCNLIANDIDQGKIPEDYELVGEIVKDICYNNAKAYFDF